jgi:hypothetical protein
MKTCSMYQISRSCSPVRVCQRHDKYARVKRLKVRQVIGDVDCNTSRLVYQNTICEIAKLIKRTNKHHACHLNTRSTRRWTLCGNKGPPAIRPTRHVGAVQSGGWGAGFGARRGVTALWIMFACRSRRSSAK